MHKVQGYLKFRLAWLTIQARIRRRLPCLVKVLRSQCIATYPSPRMGNSSWRIVGEKAELREDPRFLNRDLHGGSPSSVQAVINALTRDGISGHKGFLSFQGSEFGGEALTAAIDEGRDAGMRRTRGEAAASFAREHFPKKPEIARFARLFQSIRNDSE